MSECPGCGCFVKELLEDDLCEGCLFEIAREVSCGVSSGWGEGFDPDDPDCYDRVLWEDEHPLVSFANSTRKYYWLRRLAVRAHPMGRRRVAAS